MPELPEVEVIRRRLSPHLQGRTITRVAVRNPALRRPVPPEIKEKVPGQKIQSLGRRGKYLLFRCASGWIILHLGMTGDLRIVPAATAPEKHDHLDMVLNDHCLRFSDIRRFGSILWTEDDPCLHPLLKKLGPEPLTEAFSAEYIFARSRNRSVAVKQLLMDGNVVAGLGNIYSNEALHAAGIHPETKAGNLSTIDCRRLVKAVKKVLHGAIEEGMAAIQTPASGESEGDLYFSVTTRVYGRSAEPCPKCGTAIRQIRQAGRSTWFCPACQKQP